MSAQLLCPAHGTSGKLNHWSQVCRSTQKTKTSSRQAKRAGQEHKQWQGINALDTTEPDDDAPTGATGTSQLSSKSGQYVTPLLCKIDTGAEGNVIPVNTYKQLYPESAYDSDGAPLGLTSSAKTITAFGGQTIQHYGTCSLTLSHSGYSNTYPFHVVNTTGPTILGLLTCSDMNLVTLNYSITTQQHLTSSQKPVGDPAAKREILQQYQDCFKVIGCFKGEFHMTLDPTVPPVVHPPRRVPEALRDSLKKELDELEKQGIIARVDEPTDWVNSLVCVTKSNGALRLCLDPKDLNQAIKRPHHWTPTLDEGLPKLNGAKNFSIIDARSGYWNIQLDHKSSIYTTFNSPHGRYRFLRLPFGLICAQDIFQKKVYETFGDLPGVTSIADDIIV